MSKQGHVLTGVGLSILLEFDPLTGALGAIFPDYDIFIAKAFGTWRTRRRKRLLTAHRGFTHHLALIPLFMFLAWYWKGGTLLEFFLSSFLFGYAIHLLGDMLTPLGIPYRLSYYPRIAYPLFKTGGWGETTFLLLFALVTGIYILYTGAIYNLFDYFTSIPFLILGQILDF